MRKTFFCLLMIFAIPCLAQEKNRENSFSDNYDPSLTADFQALKYCSASVGFGFIRLQEPHSMEPVGNGIVFDNNFTFRNANKNFVYSPKITVFVNYSLLYAGANLSYHTDFKNGGTLQFAPEVGFGIWVLYLVYGRNISITKNDLIPVNKNNISLKIMLPLEMIF